MQVIDVRIGFIEELRKVANTTKSDIPSTFYAITYPCPNTA